MYQEWYHLQFLRHRVWKTWICNYGSFFALLRPPALKNKKIRILKKKKEKLLEIPSFYQYVPKTILHTVPEIGVETDNFLSFWAIFWPFTLLTTWKIKILKKKWKNNLEMSSFYTYVPKITIIWCMFSEIWSATDNFLLFWAIFCPLTPPWKLKCG